MSEAVEQVNAEGLLQPLLLKIGDKLYIKLDSNVVSLDVASLVEGVDMLLKCFYVFSLEYPWHLRAVYGFLEDLCGMAVTVRNFTAIGSFKRSLR